MRMRARKIGVFLGIAAAALSGGCVSESRAPSAPLSAAPGASEFQILARQAVADDAALADAAIARLRAAGPPGLDALFDAYAGAFARLGDPSQARKPGDPDPIRLRAAVERVARQRDAHVAHLYWYTDLEQAMSAARAAKRPILSLRLLGNLDEELSCANSRFFRTALYPNVEIARYLRDNFILHWKSERPAPKITIDFGDGRKMERTIVGNSVHYVLDWNGHPVDALPGLYGPRAFLRALQAAQGPARESGGLDSGAREDRVRAFHAERLRVAQAEWSAEIAKLDVPAFPQPNNVSATSRAPSAKVAAPTAATKAIVEMPVVGAIQGPVDPLPRPTDPATWALLLADHASDARLDAASRAFMRHKIASELDPSGRRLRPLDDATFARRVDAFEASIAEDSVRNEYAMHRVVHEWMQTTPPDDYESLNRRVYAALFLTPSTDPWLGLLGDDAYSAIENEGIIVGGEAGSKLAQ